jgi:hypothetical protein
VAIESDRILPLNGTRRHAPVGETVPYRTPVIDLRSAIEDVYELSPMQLGMLYHTIDSPRPGMYCIVVSYRLRGPLVSGALLDAWRAVVARHPVLRTSFQWRDHREPVQTVHRHVILPVVEDDWSDLTAPEQQSRLTALLGSENRRGFDLTKPPLIRLSLIRCAEDVHELVIAHHHLLLDGSCKSLLFEEVFAAYESLRRAQPVDLGRPEPYRTYIEWLRRQDLVQAERFWRQELSGVTEPTPLWPETRSDAAAGSDYEEHHVNLDEPASDQLRHFARANRLTLNVLVSAAWALVLGHGNKRNDVVFGATVNARPSTLDGVDGMLGLFINTLPVRMQLSPATPVSEWLRTAQMHQIGALEHNCAPLTLVQRWTAVPRGRPLFESIVVFENNIGYGSETEQHGTLEISHPLAIITNSLPLTLRAVPGRTLTMQLLYDRRRFSPGTVASIAEALVDALRHIVHNGNAPLAAVIAALDDGERRRAAREANTFQATAREKLSHLKRERRTPFTGES